MPDEDLAKKVASRFSGVDLFSMSNLRPINIGIANAVIWVSAGAKAQHGSRIKVVLCGLPILQQYSETCPVRSRGRS